MSFRAGRPRVHPAHQPGRAPGFHSSADLRMCPPTRFNRRRFARPRCRPACRAPARRSALCGSVETSAPIRTSRAVGSHPATGSRRTWSLPAGASVCLKCRGVRSDPWVASSVLRSGDAAGASRSSRRPPMAETARAGPPKPRDGSHDATNRIAKDEYMHAGSRRIMNYSAISGRSQPKSHICVRVDECVVAARFVGYTMGRSSPRGPMPQRPWPRGGKAAGKGERSFGGTIE